MKKSLKMPEFFTDQRISSLATEEQSTEDKRAHKILMRKNFIRKVLSSLSKNSTTYYEI